MAAVSRNQVLAIAVIAVAASSFAAADPHGRGWHGDMHHFSDYDYPHWRAGHWYHGHHDGRLGWWWIAAGMWYFYPTPVYPYPDPYQPPVVVQPQEQAAPEPEAVWYYCNSSRNYYPYVSVCPEGWQTVPARPGDAGNSR